MNGPLTGRQLVIILIVAAVLAGTVLSVRSNFHKVERIDNRTQCILGSSECR